MKPPFGAVFTFQYLLASKLEINSLTNFSRIVEEQFRCPSWYDLYPEPLNEVLVNLMVPSQVLVSRKRFQWFFKTVYCIIYVSALYTSQFFTVFFKFAIKFLSEISRVSLMAKDPILQGVSKVPLVISNLV